MDKKVSRAIDREAVPGGSGGTPATKSPDTLQSLAQFNTPQINVGPSVQLISVSECARQFGCTVEQWREFIDILGVKTMTGPNGNEYLSRFWLEAAIHRRLAPPEIRDPHLLAAWQELASITYVDISTKLLRNRLSLWIKGLKWEQWDNERQAKHAKRNNSDRRSV